MQNFIPIIGLSFIKGEQETTLPKRVVETNPGKYCVINVLKNELLC